MTSDDARLSQLSTWWTLMVRAHECADPAAAREAQADLLDRYHGAVFRYIMALVADDREAEELCQEFAYRFVRGDFRHAAPAKGRFRDYLKVALVRLAGEQRRKGATVAACDDRIATAEAPDPDRAFRDLWRGVLLDRTWEALRRECEDDSPTGYDVLRRKASDPTVRSAVLAEELARECGRPLTAANVRQILHRARVRFAELLRAETAASIPSTDPSTIDDELADLEFLTYCRPPAD